MRPLGQWIENFVQICHCRSNHWITLSTKECQVGEIKVYDSLYDEVDMVTTTMIKRLFNLTNLTVTMPLVQRQKGIKDCGLFAIANATTLAFKDSIDSAHLDQTKLRQHLVLCLEKTLLLSFHYLIPARHAINLFQSDCLNDCTINIEFHITVIISVLLFKNFSYSSSFKSMNDHFWLRHKILIHVYNPGSHQWFHYREPHIHRFIHTVF